VFLSSTLVKANIVADAKAVVLIPGSNRGIGFETVRQLGQKGITVIVAGGRGNKAADFTRKLQERPDGFEECEAMTIKTKAAVTKGERSRQKIVETAAVLFNQKGFTGCSMGDIVAASGLEKGTLYGHFSTKEELALLAFDYAWKDTSDKRLRNIDTVSNAVDKLKLHVDNYVNTPSFPGGCPLLNFAVDADDGNLALRTRVRKALKGWEDFLAKIVKDGQSAGEINPEIEPHSVANLVISTLEGATVLARINKRSSALDDAQRHLNLYLETVVRLRTDS
jgi:TetR/AcrR family transcriptional regulator, transcriptional repressor for nem operon